MTDALRESLRISSEAGLVPVYENHNQLGESPLIANFRRNHGMFDSVHTMGKNSPQDVIRTQTSNESIISNLKPYFRSLVSKCLSIETKGKI